MSDSGGLRRWNVRAGDGGVFGPYDMPTVAELVDDGRIAAYSELATEDAPQSWRRAADWPEFAGLFTPGAGERLPPRVAPPRGRALDTTLVHVAYGCYAAGALPVLPLVAAVVGLAIAYVKRTDVAGTWLESHYTWLIQTFWLGLAGWVVGGILTFVLIGFAILPLVTVWFLYRIVKGWIRLSRDEPIDEPTALF